MQTEYTLSLSSIEKLMKKAGVKRASEDARKALAQKLEERAIEIAEKAQEIAIHTGRKTVMAKDINLASK